MELKSFLLLSMAETEPRKTGAAAVMVRNGGAVVVSSDASLKRWGHVPAKELCSDGEVRRKVALPTDHNDCAVVSNAGYTYSHGWPK